MVYHLLSQAEINYLEEDFVLISTDLNALFSSRILFNEPVWIWEGEKLPLSTSHNEAIFSLEGTKRFPSVNFAEH